MTNTITPFPFLLFHAVVEGGLQPTAAQSSQLVCSLVSPQQNVLSVQQNTSVLGLVKTPTYYLLISGLLLRVKVEGVWWDDKQETDSEALSICDFFLGL